VQVAHNAAQEELEVLQNTVREVCKVMEGGSPGGSTEVGWLRALPVRAGAREGAALRLGVSHTLGVLLSHYEGLDLPRIFEGICVGPEEEGREAEVLAELVRQAEEAGTVSALVEQFRQLVPVIAPVVEAALEDQVAAKDPPPILLLIRISPTVLRAVMPPRRFFYEVGPSCPCKEPFMFLAADTLRDFQGPCRSP